MDLSLTTDFDSAILNCWDDSGEPSDPIRSQTDSSEGVGSGSTSGTQTPSRSPAPAGGEPAWKSMQSSTGGLARLPSFPTTIGGAPASTSAAPEQLQPQQASSDAAAAAANAANLANAYGVQTLLPLLGGGDQQSQVPGGMNVPQHMMLQYALSGQPGTPFSAAPVLHKTPTLQQSATTGPNVPTTGTAPPTKDAMAAVSGQQHAAVSTTTTSTAAQTSVGQQQQQPSTTTHLHPLGIQSSAMCPPHTAVPPTPAAMQFNPYLFNPFLQQAMMGNTPDLLTAMAQQQLAMSAAAQLNATAQVAKPLSTPLAPPVTAAHPAAPASVTVNTAKAPPPPRAEPKKFPKNTSNKEPTPPFLLFDAPCELRANFMATQRMLNLPLHKDTNSYHYGMAVNGFHPQWNLSSSSMDPALPLSSHHAHHVPPSLKLIDSRHSKKRGSGKERNEREQKRAQKITELIEQIRLSMEDGGWRVEMKNKYHTLSRCADYVKHLIKTNKEKEEAVEKAKSDLEIKERKLEEEKSCQESRSDPESVTSSLTASTTGSQKELDGKRKASEQLENDSKKQKSESTDDSLTTEGSSGPQGHNISLGKMSSSVSELTDSNRGSSDSGAEKTSGHAAHKKRPRESGDESATSAIPSSGSISSTAAVIRGAGSHRKEHGHADVVFKKDGHSRSRKRMRQERSSLDRKFDLDYEEVFLTSNVPQLIATPAGRIVEWNNFFLKATGLKAEDAQRLTIFSIVQPDKLANLFEMVAKALRQNSDNKESSSSSSESGRTTNESSESGSEERGYAAMTLPCISFPAGHPRDDETKHRGPLYMTLTLMPDEDVSKRCFHCILTDCPGTNGKIGFITPELLRMLFAEPGEKKAEKKSKETKAATKKKEATVDVGNDDDAGGENDDGNGDDEL